MRSSNCLGPFKMSADEDTELRDLVAQTLEANGTLGKLRAQLRASVFLALEEQEQVQNRTPFLNKELSDFRSTKDGRLLISLLHEFLEYYHLEFTAAVFQPETGMTEGPVRREALAKELQLRTGGGGGDAQAQGPLLLQLLQASQGAHQDPLTRSASSQLHEDSLCNGAQHLPQGLTEKQIEDARKKFDEYDRDDSGAIEKDELRELFMDMFPAFNSNMLERYVNDEFKAVDRDFSSSIDFDEFLGMYKRLFLQCRAVVAGDVQDILSPVHKPSPLSSIHKSGSSEARHQHNNNSTSAAAAEKSAPPLPSTPPPAPKSSTSSAQSLGKELDDLLGPGDDDDSFFDDILPTTGGGINLNNSDSSDKGGDKDAAKTGGGAKGSNAGGKAAGSSMSSLGDLPSFLSGSLTSPTSSKPPGPKEKEGESNLRSLDRRMADLGIDNDMQDDFEYEDDFQSSGHSLSQKSPRSKGSMGGGGVGGGDQGRGDRDRERDRDRTENGSVAEEIEEEEIEDISIEADDLLKSDNSGFDMTEDNSISQMDGGFDYMEDPQLP